MPFKFIHQTIRYSLGVLRLLLLLGLSSLGGCAIQGPRPAVEPNAPPQWYAPIPHQGQLSNLNQWWAQFDDPLLLKLIQAAQSNSPTLVAARTRIEQARLTRVVAGAALLPSLDASVRATKSSAQPPIIPENTTYTAGVQTAWEVDLFGANRASRHSADLRLRGAEAGWHEARISVAAEVANSYYSLRACELLLGIARSDATSRAETARLSDLSAQAGFVAPATAALARASAAEGQGRVAQQHAQCDLGVKTLVALSAMPEPELRQQLAAIPARLPDVGIIIANVPAQILAQRPDVYRAEREVEAASFEVGGAQAQRFPRLTLNGSIGATRFVAGSVSSDLSTWSIGPLALTVPLWDAGKSRANLQVARARYEEAVVNYQSTVRNAVREVEQALVNLQSTGTRGQYVIQAVEGFRASLGGTQSLYQNGLASLYDLEESRRSRFAAELAVVSLQQERIAAWIALYRAAGGGWDDSQRDIPPLTPASKPVFAPILKMD
ncbi:MAG: efflux transporter outer membrane subunit [Thiobacillus sp.]